jgi:hypothetical protein
MVIICNQCRHKNNVNCDEFDWELTDSEERGMGASSIYQASFTFDCHDSNCTQEISIECLTSIYPATDIEHCDCQVTGGEKDEDCCKEVKHPEEDLHEHY